MMSTSSSEPAALRLRSASGEDELVVTGTDFQRVAAGHGELTASLPAGIYEIAARAGPTVARRLVKLEPGESREVVGPEVRFPAAAPIPGSDNADPDHLELVRDATGVARATAGAVAGLVVVVRDVREHGRSVLNPGDRGGFGLLDGALQPVAPGHGGWLRRGDDRAAAWAGAVEPGGYALRLADGDPVDQSVWVAAGWQTIVFHTLGERGPLIESCSIEMIRLDDDWTGSRLAVSLELALWALRENRPDAVIALPRGGRPIAAERPMLAIVAAHLLLRRSKADLARIEELVADLERELPGHPDVTALRVLAAGAGAAVAASAPTPVRWPPMLLASYLGVIHGDAVSPGLIAAGSSAERAASLLSVRGIWTSWRPLADRDLEPTKLARTKIEPQRVLEKLSRKPRKLRESTIKDPATRRVIAYLRAVADLEDGRHAGRALAQVTPAQISLATSLPAATVDRSLRRIWLTLGGFMVLPLIVTLSALVGAVALATVGLLASAPILSTVGNSIPQATFPGVATPPPTIPPTVEPSSPAPQLEFRPPELQFTDTGQRLDVFVMASDPMTIKSITVGGESPGDFRADLSCEGATVDTQQGCRIDVVFKPVDRGERRADLMIQTSDGMTWTVPLRGTF
jgi:hypothetical protein